jgi:hypothetical protein
LGQVVRHIPVFKVLMVTIQYFHLLPLLVVEAVEVVAHLEMEEQVALAVVLVQI